MLHWESRGDSKLKVLVLLIPFSLLCLTPAETAINFPRTLEYSEGKYHRNLYDYRSYGAITLERINIPQHSIEAALSINILTSSDDCDQKKVKIYTNQHGLPMVSRDGEAFPSNSYIRDKDLRNVTVTNSNVTLVLTNLKQGYLFLMAVMPPPESRIKQQGLGMNCDYFLTAHCKIKYLLDEDIPQLMFNATRVFSFNDTTTFLLRLQVPVDVVSYTVKLEGCRQSLCPVNVSIMESLSSDVYNSSISQCEWANFSCILQVNYPVVNSFNYILMKSLVREDINISITTVPHYFEIAFKRKVPLTKADGLTEEFILASDLGRETPSTAEEGSNFYDYFVDWDDKTLQPHPTVNIKVLDTATVVARFKLRTSDTGSTFKLIAHAPLTVPSTSASIQICLSAHHLSPVAHCDGPSFNITTKKEANKHFVYVPYPQSGLWFISLKSQCYQIHENTSKEIPVVCTQYPIVNLTIHLSPCLDGGCGAYGGCKLYFGADLLYSACNCFSGWRGYGCNDGSEADSSSTERVSVYLLTLSNLGFMPGIILAIYRKFYVEALVYAYNMFFSTFYHACDTSEVYKLCIMPYNALSFADFFASLLSFWVTLMAMARIPGGLRSFFHMLSALLISLGEVYDRHGLVEQLLPIVGGVTIVLFSWGYQCYKKKSIYPSKRRLLYFIFPGVCLACLGLILNLAVETVENYKYVHSVWHIVESASILFLLPPKRGQKDEMNTLSVQSGDITRQRLLDNDELSANLHRADETEPGVASEPSSPPETPRGARGFKLRKVLHKPSQNLVL
ncbi:post-GPI attachment to proteins factor 6-like isoform X1 [Biomphalaria glabrata]|uniref:Post-GPI attachment to proteins factor 6-like isoform X1 n=1 Tax=Biomphalaria glabrata TaxID=6526 RepID=A0A9U8E894_BIOGL|nr:post-GPI attachment to proteins factor 6-like isoform X1 [Biomphalaria glabrata]KAI8749673.1 transmembrane protein 8A-like isoform X1 [Biomphalaria glabrata]